MSATLRDVATVTGMSRSLVSLALRGDDGVSVPRRAAAVRVADDLGLPVGALARRRAAAGPLRIGVLVTEAANPFHAEALASARASAETLGFSLCVVDAFRDEGGLRDGLEALHASAGSADGVLGVAVLSSRLGPAALAAVAADVPVAVLGSSGAMLAGHGVDTVRAEEESGMRALMVHLAAHGHVRTCFVGESDHPSTTRRAGEHERAARRFSDRDDRRVDDIEALVSDPTRIARHLGDGVTAFVAANDATAGRLLAAARDVGIPLPATAAVSGFDGTALAGRLDLTTVEQPRRRMGARVVELVVERLRGRTHERHEVLATHLELRGSTARRVDVVQPDVARSR